MDQLQDFAAGRFVAADRLPAVAADARECAERTGDARFSVLAETLDGVVAWWPEQGAPTARAESIITILASRLPSVLDAETPVAGTKLARDLQHEVRAVTEHDWRLDGPAQEETK